ncbi:MAG: transporter, partial [bacterium]
FWAFAGEQDEKPVHVRPVALLTPLIPIFLILSFNLYNLIAKPPDPYSFPINSALLIGVVYGAVTTFKRDGRNVQRVTRCIIEGVGSSAPAVGLVIGIGMVLKAVWHPAVGGYMEPALNCIMPKSMLWYVVGFSLLAPLALYRGPLNIWGMGSGLVAIMLATNALPAAAIMGALLSVGMIQGVCDPTNTHNAWLAGYLGVDVMIFTRRTLPYMWALAVFGLIVAGFMFL